MMMRASLFLFLCEVPRNTRPIPKQARASSGSIPAGHASWVGPQNQTRKMKTRRCFCLVLLFCCLHSFDCFSTPGCARIGPPLSIPSRVCLARVRDCFLMPSSVVPVARMMVFDDGLFASIAPTFKYVALLYAAYPAPQPGVKNRSQSGTGGTEYGVLLVDLKHPDTRAAQQGPPLVSPLLYALPRTTNQLLLFSAPQLLAHRPAFCTSAGLDSASRLPRSLPFRSSSPCFWISSEICCLLRFLKTTPIPPRN